jgi:hypothetical protein
MKVIIEESYPGELDLPTSELQEKLHKALAVATDGRRGGEVDVIGELATLTVDSYNARMNLMTADVAKLLEPDA